MEKSFDQIQENTNKQTEELQKDSSQISSVSKKNKFSKFLVIIFVSIFFIGIGALGMYFYMIGDIKERNENIVAQASPTPISEATKADETDEWKIYSDKTEGYEFKYPSNYVLSDTRQLLNHKIEWLVSNLSFEQCRGGGCLDIKNKEEKILNNNVRSTKLKGYRGGDGGNIPESFIAYEIKYPAKEKYFFITLWELDQDNMVKYKDYPGDRNPPDFSKEDEALFDKILSTFRFSDSEDDEIKQDNRVTKTDKQVINGASLAEIKYSLPSDWKAQLNSDSLLLSPNSGGGYLSIKVYSYSGTGRRTFYCKNHDTCIDGISKFDEVKIGNISGYEATALDNSGSGEVYFGAKGTKFYVIDTFSPPSPNDFDNNFQSVLDSLIF